MRDEDPPNKEVYATDLAAALEQIGRKWHTEADTTPQPMDVDVPEVVAPPQQPSGRARSRADSRTIVFHPEEHGHSPDLPAIAVEDTTNSPVDLAPEDGLGPKVMAHTSRPPVELMSS